MPPPARFTYHHHAATGSWYVYDRVLDRTVRIETSGVTVARLAVMVTCASRAAVLWAIDRALTFFPRCRLVLAHRVAAVAATRALLGLDDRRDQDRGHSHPCYLKWRRRPENEQHDRCTQEEQENCERVIAPGEAPGRGTLRRWGLWRAVGHVVSF